MVMPLIAQALVVAGCCWGTPAPDAQAAPGALDPAPVPPWVTVLSYDHTEIGGPTDPWNAVTLAVGRRFRRGAIELSARRVDRGVGTDVGVGFDAYVPTWTGGYANLRVHSAPDAVVVPTLGSALEMFQVLSPALEASVLVREDRFPDANVRVIGGSLAGFTGPWALRGRVNAAAVGGEWTTFGSAQVRRSLGDRDNFIELGGGAGREVVEILLGDPGLVHPDIRTAAIGNIAAQLMAGRHIGARVGLGYSSYDGLRDRVTGSVGLVARW